MKILIVGGGGREHAIAWALSKSARVTEIVAAPGNAGMAQVARCVPAKQDVLADLMRVAEQEQPDLTIVGPEVPLALGMVDALNAKGMRAFGPTKAAAQLESSKSFAKDFMERHKIPTARYRTCSSVEDVRRALADFGDADAPVVVKADGLAAGKGVVIAANHAEAIKAAEGIFSGTLLGKGEATLVLEEFLEGPEVSFFALCDGTHAVALAAAQDHKRIGEGDTGPNTGGMGTYCTDTLITPEMRTWMTKQVAQKVVDGMREEGTPFKGILFCGMMMTARGPMVLEFNTRWGDPETQSIMMRLESDALELFEAAVEGKAQSLQLKWKPGASACVIVASGGYPGKHKTGLPIRGMGEPFPADVQVFHSGTALRDGEVVTAGGRVLGVTAAADDLRSALAKAYEALGEISFEGMQFRRDIGHRAL
ncbi:MAG: phosphoribosylamine--glycine ligase [Acidobacteria bacterium]|nr:phosphoribosylamine--glycine ligase [Acidobacteriota bacterium]